MRILATTALLIGLAVSCSAQALDPVSSRILEITKDAQTPKDLATLLREVPKTLKEKTLWLEAVHTAGRVIESGDVDRSAVIRLMEIALIKMGVEADNEPLNVLSSADIASMRDAIGFPGKCDVLLYLLNRGPSVHDNVLWGGEYVVNRIAPPGDLVTVKEWANLHFMGIGPDGHTTRLKEEDDPVCKNIGEYGKTQRLNLDALPDIVLAAKAYRVAERVGQEFAAYPLLVGAYAVNAAFKRNPKLDFRPMVYFAELKALKALKGYTETDPSLSEQLIELQRNQPRAAFLARLFGHAAQAYERAEREARDKPTRVAAMWGRAISLFAYGAEETRVAFDDVSTHLDEGTSHYSGMFGLLLRYITDEEAKWLRDRDSWLNKVDNVLGRKWRDKEKLFSVVSDDDFMDLMLTIGRPDIAGRYLMDRIDLIKGNKRENYLLRELAAFTRDYCYMISFELSEASGWVRRETRGYNPLLDFLDSFNSSGALVNGGEVVVSDVSYEPYPSLSPEEDCAVSSVVYGVYSDLNLRRLDESDRKTIVDWQEKSVRGFESWVREAMSRRRPAPSLVPYFKLLFQDWFFQSFDALKDPKLEARGFSYRPFGASEMAREEAVVALRQHPASTTHVKNLIDLFVTTRRFLEKHYP